MELKQELGLKARISQEMIQSASVLQMNTQEITAYLQEIMLENPVMEMEETRSLPQDRELERKLEWLETGDYQNKIYYRQERESQSQDMAEPGEPDLREYLLEQLIYMEVEQSLVPVLRYLIQSLDEQGYLKEQEEDTAEFLGISSETVRQAKAVLCTMEPAGVGARNLRECLLLQLRRREHTELARSIVEQYLEECGKNQIGKIARALKQKPQAVEAACEKIRGLNPRPSNCFSSRPYKNYITPDIIVVKLRDYFEIYINDYDCPRISINTYYTDLLKRETETEAADYIRTKLKQAKWLQSCMAQRQRTLLKLAEVILRRQGSFFQKGRKYLVPVTQKEAAEEMGVSPSTVSRAVNGKYLQCTWGVYPLAFFFTQGVEQGQEKTAEYVKSCIRQIIDGEAKEQPYSDRLISEKLREMDLTVSRRTVAKYREAMGIRDALGRKSYGNPS